ncbi:MAG: sulfatase-like hydrolase/transferase [Pontiellaceae bacterium]|nr:sulfatase-like hydrolase/transferase [Pontiellaceae bacterium]
MNVLPKGCLLLYPVAGFMQFPLILAIALIHFALNILFDLLPERFARKGQWLTCTLFLFVCTGVYLSSQIMRIEIGSFLSWDMLGVAISDTKQLLPDIGRRIGVHLLVLALLTSAIGFGFVRYYHHTSRHVGRIFAIIMAVVIGLSGTSFAMVMGSSKPSAWQVQYDMLPTTFLASTLAENFMLSDDFAEEAIATIQLEPRTSLEEYLEYNAPQKTPNIFLIVLESITWNHFSFTGYERQDITPNLQALSEQSTLFPLTYATANHSNYAQPSIHSSQYPLRTKALNNYTTVDYPKTMLIDILAQSGYQTAFISSQNEDWLGMKSFIFADTELQYFRHSKDELGDDIGAESKIDDKLTCSWALDYLDQRDPETPVFLYMNLQRTHFPYDIPEEADHPYQPCSTDDFQYSYFGYPRDQIQTVVNKYDNALHYVDEQVGTFINYLKENDLYEDSLIIVTTDHGESFYEHGLPTHSSSLYDDQIRVCTLVKEPGQQSAAVRNDPISQIDINPTILEILGMDNYPSFQGEPILNNPRTNPIYFICHSLNRGIGILDYPLKFIRPETRHPHLTNIEEDPSETIDYSSEDPERMMELRKQLEIFRQQQLYYYMDLSPEERQTLFPPRL